MAIYITGDTHGELSTRKLSSKTFKEGHSLTKNDYVIIAGDFGLIFHPVQTPGEKYWLEWLESRPWTTLFVDGNHENFDKLNTLPIIDKFGGKVGKVSESICHLRRGEIYLIDNKKVLAFGGAASIDKLYRQEGVSWWKDEIPSYADMDNCLCNLEKHNNKVDIIVAHTCPNFLVPSIIAKSGSYEKESDPTAKMLDHIVSTCEFDSYYCGHWHVHWLNGKYNFLYGHIVKV